MGKLVNRCKMTVTGTPGTGAITLGSAATGFLGFATAGVVNADVVSYLCEDGAAWEYGQGTYASSGTTLTRTTILYSSSGAATAVSLSSSATVTIVPQAADIAGLGANTYTGVQTLPAGAVATPALTFGSSANTGFYQISAASIGMTLAGVNAMVVDANNVGYGINTMASITSGINNVANGVNAGKSITTGSNNFAAGFTVMGGGGAVTGNHNIGIGQYSMPAFAALSGSYNTGLGVGALGSLTSASFQVAIGGYALTNISNTTFFHIAIGWQALRNLTNAAQYNIAIGHGAGYKLTDASNNIVIGANALIASQHASNCIAIGVGVLQQYADALPPEVQNYNCNSIGIGTNALYNISTGYENVAIGTSALGVATTSTWCTGIGIQAMQALTTGNFNTGVGLSTLNAMTTGSGCTAIGMGAGGDYMGTVSTTVAGGGISSLGMNVTGNWNTYLGAHTANATANQRNFQTIIGCNSQGVDKDNSITLGRIGTDVVYAGLTIVGAKDYTGVGYTVSTLPAASAALKGARSFVTDATTPSWNAALVGGGAIASPVFCNGSAWVTA